MSVFLCVQVFELYLSVSVRRNSMCFLYMKCNFVAKTWKYSICCFCPVVYYIYLLGSVVVGFGYFAVLGCEDIWNNWNCLVKWYGHVMWSRSAWNYVRCAFPWKELHTLEGSAANQIQAFIFDWTKTKHCFILVWKEPDREKSLCRDAFVRVVTGFMFHESNHRLVSKFVFQHVLPLYSLLPRRDNSSLHNPLLRTTKDDYY